MRFCVSAFTFSADGLTTVAAHARSTGAISAQTAFSVTMVIRQDGVRALLRLRLFNVDGLAPSRYSTSPSMGQANVQV